MCNKSNNIKKKLKKYFWNTLLVIVVICKLFREGREVSLLRWGWTVPHTKTQTDGHSNLYTESANGLIHWTLPYISYSGPLQIFYILDSALHFTLYTGQQCSINGSFKNINIYIYIYFFITFRVFFKHSRNLKIFITQEFLLFWPIKNFYFLDHSRIFTFCRF